MNTGRELLKRIIAMLVIAIMLVARISMLGNSIISYAIDAMRTSNENVEILAYFEKENQEKVTEIESEIDKTVTLKVDVTVKNENGYGGYFDGEINLANSNFKAKNTGKIGVHVNAGETKTVAIEVEYEKIDNIYDGYVNQESQVLLKGTYVNSRGSYEVEGTAPVKTKWISTDNTEAITNMEVLTNRIFAEKKVLQILVDSNVKNDSYPVKNIQTEIDIPDGATNVKVHGRNSEITDYEVKEDTKKVIINAKEDTLVVTYEFDKEANIEGTIINGTAKVILYDDKELETNSSVSVDEVKDGSVSSEIVEKEKEIYKGRIYTGEAREYISTNILNIDYADAIENIEINEEESVYTTKDNSDLEANINIVSTTISNSNLLDIFGEDGYISIKDQDGNTVANINKDTEKDENGDIIVKYGENVTSINIVTSKPIKNGKLNIINSKKIEETKLSRTEKESLTGIKDKVEVNQKIAEGIIDLKETNTDAKIEIENKNLKTLETNENVKMVVTLLTNGEDKDLYKNPKLEIVFPSEVSKVEASYRLLYSNGLKFKEKGTISMVNGHKVLTFDLEGEQEKYQSEAVDGPTIETYLNIDLDDNAETGSKDITLNFTNDNAVSLANNGTKTANVNIIAQEKKPVIETTVSASVGENLLKNNDEVKAGEVIKYHVEVKNTGNADAENVNIKGLVPEGTKLVEVDERPVTALTTGEEPNERDQELPEDFDYYIEKDDIEVNKTVNVKRNEKVLFEYEVKVNKDIENGKESNNTINISYNDEKVNTTNIKHILKSGDIELTMLPILRKTIDEKMQEGHTYVYSLRVKNNSNVDKENVNIDIKNNEFIKLISVDLDNGENQEDITVEEDFSSLKVSKIKAGETKYISIGVKIKSSENVKKSATISAIAKDNNVSYRSNKVEGDIQEMKLDVTIETSNNNEYIEAGDEVIYTINVKNTGDIDLDGVRIEGLFSNDSEIESIEKDGTLLNEDTYVIDNSDEDNIIKMDDEIKAGKSTKLEVKTKLDEKLLISEDKEITGEASASFTTLTAESGKIVHKVKANSKEQDESGTDDQGEDNPDGDDSTEGENKKVSGIVWLDENKNGIRETNEKLLNGIEINLIDEKTSQIAKNPNGDVITALTNENGMYTLNNIPQGKYIVIFKYDTNTYSTTKYQVSEANSSTNSDVISKTLTIDGKSTLVGATDTLDINKNLQNIDMGLVEKGTFDLELTKTVSKVVVNNKKGTKTYEYNDTELAKVEINSKYLKGSIVIIEYNIKVKNTGTTSGYVKNIVDYYPSSLRFVSELNNDWYQSGNYLYNESLANEEIKPGEEKEIPLVLTLTMTESNTGLINNTAEIAEASSLSGISDIDSVPGNQEKNEDDRGSADVIIGVVTGALAGFISITIAISVLIGISALMIYKKIIIKKLKI